MKFTVGREYENASDGVKSLITHEHKIQETLRSIETQLYNVESDYLEETASHGNVFYGWDGFLDAKPGKKEIFSKKSREEAEHLFSSSAVSWKQLLSGGPATSVVQNNTNVVPNDTQGKSRKGGKKPGPKASKMRKRKRDSGAVKGEEEYTPR